VSPGLLQDRVTLALPTGTPAPALLRVKKAEPVRERTPWLPLPRGVREPVAHGVTR
jgi:hypothetical protein